MEEFSRDDRKKMLYSNGWYTVPKKVESEEYQALLLEAAMCMKFGNYADAEYAINLLRIAHENEFGRYRPDNE
ncbi:MAG TPA: hypothetical protein VLG09_02595 [Candidatus Saccharimonadales bacterium]|nr:hypothetical protein [Candidatus Saccharimonadales bacterium]